MRILLLVPRHFRKRENLKTDEVWSETSLPIYQVHNFWYKALKSLGHEVILYIYSGKNPELDYWSTLLKHSFEKIRFGRSIYSSFAKVFLPAYIKQRELKDLAKYFLPELVIVSGNTDNVFPETLLHIQRTYGSKLILLNGLSPAIFATRSEKIMAEYFDGIFTNDSYHAIDWLMLGAKFAKSLPISAIDPQICKPYPLTSSEKHELQGKVAFVGSLLPGNLYKDRIEVLEQIADFGLRIWTHDKESVLANPKLKKCYAGEAVGKKMFKILNASKISLNLHGHTMPAGGNIRTFEITGCGGFELIDRVNPAWFAIDKEIVTFKNVPELKDKIKFYLIHDKIRLKIAKAGYLRTIKDHNYKNRFATMLKLIQ